MANLSRESIIQVSARISQLREVLNKTKDELKQAEAQLDKFLAGEAAGGANLFTRSSYPAAEPLSAQVDQSLNQRIINLIDSEPHRDFSSEDLFGALPDANQTSVRSALARLAEDRIRRSGRGRYQSLKAEIASPPVEVS
jgi:hypothetical protein